MADDVILPSLGQTTNELTIIEWFKKDGDAVQKGDVLLEVETDKAVVPVEAFAEGILKDIRWAEGDLVEVGSVLAVIMSVEEAGKFDAGSSGVAKMDAAGTTIVQNAGDADANADAARSSAQKYTELVGHKPVSTAAGERPSVTMAEIAGDYILASPLAKRIAREHGIDLRSVKSSGKDGIIKAEDVTAFVASSGNLASSEASSAASSAASSDASSESSSIASSAASSVPSSAASSIASSEASSVSSGYSGSRTKLSKMRKTIAERLSHSKQTIPHYYVTVHADVSELVRIRDDFKHQMGVDVSYNSFLFRACAIALRKFPAVNSSLEEDYIVTHSEINIGLAVEVEDGLRVPVIRGVDEKSVWELTSQLKETADRAKQGRLSAAESSGGTFTISSLGMFGVDEFSAIINPPEAAILAVGRISKRPFVYGDEVRSGMGITLTLSVDHRIIDGALGGRFLNAVRDELEHPHRLLIPSAVCGT